MRQKKIHRSGQRASPAWSRRVEAADRAAQYGALREASLPTVGGRQQGRPAVRRSRPAVARRSAGTTCLEHAGPNPFQRKKQKQKKAPRMAGLLFSGGKSSA
jgi:hypothetical protein